MIKKTITGGQSLPFPSKPSGSIAGRTMQESIYSPLPEEKRLPDDAPNILIVLIDDAGPGLPDVFGGEVHTPTLARVYNRITSYNVCYTKLLRDPFPAVSGNGRAALEAAGIPVRSGLMKEAAETLNAGFLT